MTEITNRDFGGERPLFDMHGLQLSDVTIHAGESSLKRCRDIVARDCTFEGKYPLWHCENFSLTGCTFTVGGRAAIWYSKDCDMRDCTVDAPKMFRMMMGINIERTGFSNGEEMLWDCADIRMRHVSIDNCDYLLMHSHNIDIDHYVQHGNYSFQYCTGVTIRNAEIHSKDAFWNTDDVTIIDSELHGEYLGWYSKRLTLINCRISGTQPLCYINGLTMINCILESDCDLAFEESVVNADLACHVTSVKNPRHGIIKSHGIGEVILDRHILPDSDCKIITFS